MKLSPFVLDVLIVVGVVLILMTIGVDLYYEY